MTDQKGEPVIRRLEAGDYDAWLPLWQGYLAYYESTVTDAATQTTWGRLIDPNEQPHGLCAEDASGRMMGIVHFVFHRSTWTETDYCYLEDLFVDPGVRGSGAGRALIKAVEAEARLAGSTRLYWTTQHFNIRARMLYDRVSTLSPFLQYRTKL